MNTSRAPAPSAKAARRPGRGLLAVTLLLPALLCGLGLVLAWLLASPPGSAWLLRQVPHLQVDAPQGSLLGDFSARQLQYRTDTLQLAIQGLRWQGLRPAWSSSPRLWGILNLDTLHADAVSLDWRSSGSPAAAPQDLTLPVGLQIRQLDAGRIDLKPLGGLQLQGLRAALNLGGGDGLTHQVQIAALQWQDRHLSLEAMVHTTGDLQVDAQAQMKGRLPPGQDAALPIEAQLDWHGPLRQGDITLNLTAASQRLQAKGRLTPFAPLPLASLQIEADGLDLAALHPQWPQTRLSGQLAVDHLGSHQPARIEGKWRNLLPRPWSSQGLPVRTLAFQLQWVPEQWQQLQLDLLSLQLGSGAGPAGQLDAQGRLSATGTGAGQIRAHLQDVRLDQLDNRLAALSLDGDVDLRALAQASPEYQFAGELHARRSSASDTGTDKGPLAREVRLRWQALLSERQVRIMQAKLEGGTSTLQLEGTLQRPAADARSAASSSPWQAQWQVQAQDFDPRLVWAGAPGSVWRSAASSLNLDARARLQGLGFSTSPEGTLTLKLLPSQLAGQPLQGQLQYAHQADPLAVSLELHSGDSQLLGQISGHPGRNAQWQGKGQLQAIQLATWSPWLRMLWPQAQLNGKLQARWEAQAHAPAGSMPSNLSSWALNTQGDVTLTDFKGQGIAELPAIQAERASLNWQWGSDLHQALNLDTRFEYLRVGDRLFPGADAHLSGSWAQQQLSLHVQSGALALPAALTAWLGLDKPPANSQLELELQGGFEQAPLQSWLASSGVSWQSQIQTLQWRAVSLPATPTPAPLLSLDAGKPELRLQVHPAMGLTALQLSPGGLNLGPARLHWQALSWDAPHAQAEPARVQIDAVLDPVPLAPMLARLQPDLNWAGDLAVAGQLHVRRNAENTRLNLLIERRQGDLSINAERSRQAIGLSEMRVELNANQGDWTLSQALAGANLGGIAGGMSWHSAPTALVPTLDAQVQGTFQANVSNLTSWGAWVPPGWRLGGALDATLSLAGTLGAPSLHGHVAGRQMAVSNPLLGINVKDGSFELALHGSKAVLEQLQARSGDGTLQAHGELLFGPGAEARLEAQADRLALLNRVDRRLTLSGQTVLAFNRDSIAVNGKVKVDEGLFDVSHGDAPGLDDDVEVVRRNQAAAPTASNDHTPSRQVKVALAIDLGEHLQVRGHGLSSSLQGELQLTQQGGKPALQGTVRAVGGTFNAYGQKLDIEKGLIEFSGPFDNPRLDVLAIRSDLDTRVGVTVSGTAQSPRIKLYSDPDMADTEKLSWLVLGRGSDSLGRTDTALLQRAALALLSGEGESPSARIVKNIGLDEFSIGSSSTQSAAAAAAAATGDDTAANTVVRVGKHLGGRWYLGYERGINATTGSWQVIYRIAKQFTLRAQTGDSNALDLIWQWSWD